MAELSRITFGHQHLIAVDADPTSSGVSAPLGSIAIMSDGSNIFLKTGSGDTAWTGRNILNSTPADGQLLKFNGSAGKFDPYTPDNQVVEVSSVTTTSGSFTDLTGATLTTSNYSSLNYLINFSGTFTSSTAATITLRLVIDGSAISNSDRGATFTYPALLSILVPTNTIININHIASIDTGKIVKLQWKTSAGTATCETANLVMRGI